MVPIMLIMLLMVPKNAVNGAEKATKHAADKEHNAAAKISDAVDGNECANNTNDRDHVVKNVADGTKNANNGTKKANKQATNGGSTKLSQSLDDINTGKERKKKQNN